MPKAILPVVVAVVVVTGAFLPRGVRADGFTREYRVKAGFIVNLVRFTTWPETRRPEPGEPFRIGICGSMPAARIVARALSGGRMVRGHVILARVGDIEDLLDSHLVFVAGPVGSRYERLFPVLQERSILSVGEDDGFLSMGGVVNFSVVAHRLVIDINKAAADRSDLALSARLLQVARTVITRCRALAQPAGQR